MTTATLFNELETITQKNIHYLEKEISNLSNDQLVWKPSIDSWNIREVLAHLMEYAKYYHSAFSKKIDTTKFRDPKEVYTSSPLGISMLHLIKLGNANNIRRKLKAYKLYNPTFVPSIVTESVEQDFIKSQHELLNIIRRAKEINVRKAKITLANTPGQLVKFRMGDALLYIVYHNQRHIQQIINLTKHTKFPSI